MLDLSTVENAGPFWADDQPAIGVTVTNDEPLTDYTQIVPSFDGISYAPVPIEDPDDPITVPWPAEFTAGDHLLSLTAERASGPGVTAARLRLGSLRVFVMEDDGWFNLESARDQWPGNPSNDGTLWDVLTIAKEQVIEFGREIGLDYDPLNVPPARWRTAQLMQAKALWEKNKADSDDQLNTGQYGVTIYPLDKTIRSVIRPKKGGPTAIMAPNGR